MRKLLCVVAIALLAPATAHADKAAQKKLAQARVDAAAKAYDLLEKEWEMGSATPEQVGDWSERWTDAERDQGLKGKALATALAANVDRVQALADGVAKHVAAGTEPTADADIAAYYLAEAQLWAARGR